MLRPSLGLSGLCAFAFRHDAIYFSRLACGWKSVIMNIEALHYFIGLIQDGSFNKAAKRLFISPQGLNRAVSSLELQLGVSLIERGPSGVSPTPEGNIFLKHAMAIVEERCSMADEILSYRASKMSASTKHLHITITPYLASVGLGRIWDMSSMNVGSVRELPLRRLLEEVPHSQPGDIFVADLFLKTRKKIRAIGELAFEPVFATRVGIIRSKAFPWKTKEPLRYADVAELPIAYTSDSTNNGLVAYLFKNAPLKNNCLQSSNLNTLLSWVHDRKAVCLFDSFAFYRLQKRETDEADGLIFTPFADEEAVDVVGYLHRAGVSSDDATYGLAANSKLIFARDSADYLRQYPLPREG